MYIILEGIDGAGKTTQTKLLDEYLTKKGYATKTLVEPTQSEIGKLIRKELLKKESTNDTNQQMLGLLFAADRMTIKDEILKYKDSSDKILLSDRSFYSSIAYQNNASIEDGWIEQLNKYAPRPDLLLLLDLDEEEAIKRCDEEEVFETREFLKKTRENYLKFKDEEFTRVVDVTGSIDESHKKIRKIVDEILEKQ